MAKVRKSERGFTLTELLIVVAILGILIAVVLPNFVGLLGNAQDTSGEAELNIIQTAVDVRMANENLATFPPVTTATNDTATLGLYPQYMRSATTTGTYTIAADGTVTQVTTGY
jgi:prepilin-type N-terminal cleavage/methylation domain-containing protein